MIRNLLKATDEAIANDDGKPMKPAVVETLEPRKTRPAAPKPTVAFPTFKDIASVLVRLMQNLQDAEDDLDAIERANGDVPVVKIGDRAVPLQMNREAMLIVKRNTIDELSSEIVKLAEDARDRARMLVTRDPDEHRASHAAEQAMKDVVEGVAQ